MFKSNENIFSDKPDIIYKPQITMKPKTPKPKKMILN